MVRSVARRKLSKWLWMGMTMVALLPFGLWQAPMTSFNLGGVLPEMELPATKAPADYRFAKRPLQLVGLDGAVTIFTFDGTTFYPVFTLPSGTKIRTLQHEIVNGEVFALVRVVRTGEQGWVSQSVIESVPGRKDLFSSILFSGGTAAQSDNNWKVGVPLTADAIWMQVNVEKLDSYDVFQFRVIAPNGQALRSNRFRGDVIEGNTLEVKLPIKAEMRGAGTWRVELTLNDRPAGVIGFRVYE